MNERIIIHRLQTLMVLIAVVVLISLAHSLAGAAVGQSEWTVPSKAKEMQNPVKADARSLQKGKELYQKNCTMCHGATGAGDGMMAAKLNPKPAPINKKSLANQTDGELFWKISEGKLPMPAFKKTLTDEDRWSLVNYIRTL